MFLVQKTDILPIRAFPLSLEKGEAMLQKICDVAKEAFEAGVKHAFPGSRTSALGNRWKILPKNMA